MHELTNDIPRKLVWLCVTYGTNVSLIFTVEIMKHVLIQFYFKKSAKAIFIPIYVH